MEKIKIFVSYKDRHTLLKNDIVTPIQSGRAIANEILDEMLGDDTGDNISAQNPRYNELTAQYWVWKHYEEIGNPQWVGFMHYRRQFIFDPNLKHLPFLWLARGKFYYVKKIYKNYINHFAASKILPFLKPDVSCIAFKKLNIKYVSAQLDMKHHFYKGMPYQKKEVFEIFENVIINEFPQYAETFEEFKNQTFMHCCNSFIMPKALFFEYSEFLFGVLARVDKLVDYSTFNTGELRFLGFLGEYLLTIFLFHKSKDPDFKLTELAGTYVSQDYKRLRRKFVKYRILTKITSGKCQKRYLKKLAKVRRNIDLKDNK